MTYVIGDVHGCFDEMISLIRIIENKDKDAHFIFVGDFVDRGKQVVELVEWAMDNISVDGKYRTVCGNHEDMVIEWYEKWKEWRESQYELYVKAKKEPKTDYDFYWKYRNAGLLRPEKIEPIIQWMKSLPISINLEINGVKYIIAHAWKPSYDGDRNYSMWLRQWEGNENGKEIIVHGHTPTIVDYFMDKKGHVPGMISYKANEINIDGGCVLGKHNKKYPCMLCAICLDTLEEIYPWTLEERFAILSGKNVDDPYIVKKASRFRQRYFKKICYREEMLKKLDKHTFDNYNESPTC